MSAKENVIKEIPPNHPDAEDLIQLCVGNPTKNKMQNILKQYHETNKKLFGCFQHGQELVGVVGIEFDTDCLTIKHLSVKKSLQSKGIGKQLVYFLRDKYSNFIIFAETDNESVVFYKKLGFKCLRFKGKYGDRFVCNLNSK